MPLRPSGAYFGAYFWWIWGFFVQRLHQCTPIVRERDDQPTIQYPYFHLSGDQLWELVPKPGEAPIYRSGATSGAPTVADLRQRVAYGQFDDRLWVLMSHRQSRYLLRNALIARYFPERREELEALVSSPPSEKRALRDQQPPGRDAAFRHAILEVYDYRCAACGVRVLLNQERSLVEAALLIPFGVSGNDKPTNGMALCPNHHWAMDRHLIAPCPDDKRRAGIWRINGERLDERIEGQRELVALNGKPVIPPSEAKFYPATESLQ